MDFGSPVVQGTPYDPMRAVSTLQGLLSIKQQQLGLQQQQQELLSQQAAATQAQVHTQNLQNLQAVNWKQFNLPNGGYDYDGMRAKAQEVGGVDAPEFIANQGTMMQHITAARQAMFALNQQEQEPVRSIAGAWAQGKGDENDLSTSLGQYADTLDPDSKAQVLQIISGMRGALDSPQAIGGAPRTLEQKKAMALNFSRMGFTPEEVAKPVLGTMYDKNGNLVGTAQAPLSGEVTQAGGGVQPGLGPTQTPTYQAAVTSAQARAGAVSNIDTQRAAQVSASIQPSNAGISLTQQIDSLADQIHSGKFADEISKGAANVGMQTATYARQLLKKDLGQLETVATKNSPSDEASRTILSGYPEATSDPQTIHAAMDYIRGSLKQNLARGNILSSLQKKDPLLGGFQRADDAYTGTISPLMTEFQSLKTPQERINFYRRNFRSPQEAQAFKAQLQGATHVIGGAGGP